jgi:hypothetical protein
MSFKIVTVCYRCGSHRAVVTRSEDGKKRGYCRQCIAFLNGETKDAPPLRHALAVPTTGWMKG